MFVHAVLGGPEPDVDTVAATLSLSLHLSQVTLFCLFMCWCLLCVRLHFVLKMFGEYLRNILIIDNNLLT